MTSDGVVRRVLSLWVYVYWTAATLIFGWAFWLRFSLPGTPIADPDTWGYLSPAMGRLIGTGWVHHLRNYLYPGFLLVLLRCFDDFRAITVGQHLLGVVAGGIFLLVWRRIRDFASPPLVPRTVHSALGLCAVAVYLFAREPIRFETDIRPEGIVSFLVILNIWLVVEFVWRFWVCRTERLPWLLGVAAIGSAIVLSLAKPSFAIAATGGVIPVAASLFGRAPARSRLAFLLGSALTVGLLLVPEQFLARGDEDSETFLPTELFMIHAAIIRDQMAVDLASGAELPWPNERLRRIERKLGQEIAKSDLAHTYPTLGLNPDYLMFRPDSFNAWMHQEFQWRLGEICDFYRFYYVRAWREKTSRMLGKIGRQMLLFYSPLCPVYYLTKVRPIADEYARSLKALAEARSGIVWAAYDPLVSLIADTQRLARSGLALRIPRDIRRWEWFLSVNYLPCLTAALAMGLGAFLRPELWRRIGWLAALIIFLYWYSFGNCLEIAVVHTLEVNRYVRAQLIFTILAQAATFLLAAQFCLSAVVSRRELRARRCAVAAASSSLAPNPPFENVRTRSKHDRERD